MNIFIGVLINAGLVVVGTAAGCIFKNEKVKRIADRVFQIFALFVILLGIEGALGIAQPLKALVFIVIGTAIGELIDIDKQLSRLGNWAGKKVSKSKNAEAQGGQDTEVPSLQASAFSTGFVQATLLFCIGSMTFIGALESGIQNIHTTYITKGMLDCVSSVTLAATYGAGVGLSAVSILLYQGLLTAFAGLLQPVLLPEVVALSAQIGSLMLVGIGLNMLGVTKLKVANFLPAMFLPMIWQAVSTLF